MAVMVRPERAVAVAPPAVAVAADPESPAGQPVTVALTARIQAAAEVTETLEVTVLPAITAGLEPVAEPEEPVQMQHSPHPRIR